MGDKRPISDSEESGIERGKISKLYSCSNECNYGNINEVLHNYHRQLSWQKITAEDLDLSYCKFLTESESKELFDCLEREIVYFSGEKAKVKVFGKWHPIPRQQVSYGDPGLKYKFSGTSVPALPWLPVLLQIRNILYNVVGVDFNFVLINRYRNGHDHIGEHRDDESELDSSCPIASLSLGQARRFSLRHCDARKKGSDKRNVPPVKIILENGSLLLMNPPTNHFWYHSLPSSKSCQGVRINLTFRRIRVG